MVTDGYKQLLDRFIKNPTLVIVFGVCFIAVPVLAYVIYSDKTKSLKICQEKRQRTDSLMLEFVKSSSKNEGIIEALEIVTQKDTTK